MEPTTLHERLEAKIGVDVRLFYGLLVPAAVVVVFVAGLALSPTWWLLVPLMIVLLGAIGVVMVGINQILDEE